MTKKLDNISKLANTYKEYLALIETKELSSYALEFCRSNDHAISDSMCISIRNYVQHVGQSHCYSRIENDMKTTFNEYLMEWLNINIHRCMKEIIEKMENDYLKEIDKDIDSTFEELLKLKNFKDRKRGEK